MFFISTFQITGIRVNELTLKLENNKLWELTIRLLSDNGKRQQKL